MKRLILLSACVAVISSPAAAEVKTISDTGFSVLHTAQVDAAPDIVWKRLIAPKLWWSKAHSWSGSVDGFTLDARAGGCFCEAIQEKGADGKLKTVGTVEHMRVIYAHPQKVLRMQGALGPLQAEAVLGTLTIAMEKAKDGEGTTINFSYVAGGYMRQKLSSISGAVNGVLGEQFQSLISPWAAAATVETDSPASVEKPADKSKGKLILNIDDLVDAPQEDATSEEMPVETNGDGVAPAQPPKPKAKPLPKPLPAGEDGEAR